jgi:hypothetical protein
VHAGFGGRPPGKGPGSPNMNTGPRWAAHPTHSCPLECPLTCGYSILRRVNTAFCPRGVRSFRVCLVSATHVLDQVPSSPAESHHVPFSQCDLAIPDRLDTSFRRHRAQAKHREPSEQGARRHDPVQPQVPGQHLRQRSDHRTVSPVRPRGRPDGAGPLPHAAASRSPRSWKHRCARAAPASRTTAP